MVSPFSSAMWKDLLESLRPIVSMFEIFSFPMWSTCRGSGHGELFFRTVKLRNINLKIGTLRKSKVSLMARSWLGTVG